MLILNLYVPLFPWELDSFSKSILIKESLLKCIYPSRIDVIIFTPILISSAWKITFWLVSLMETSLKTTMGDKKFVSDLASLNSIE